MRTAALNAPPHFLISLKISSPALNGLCLHVQLNAVAEDDRSIQPGIEECLYKLFESKGFNVYPGKTEIG